jgi:hypothetical protein
MAATSARVTLLAGARREKPLEREHFLMINAEQCGLHHPGNIVPCCKDCQKEKGTLKMTIRKRKVNTIVGKNSLNLNVVK